MSQYIVVDIRDAKMWLSKSGVGTSREEAWFKAVRQYSRIESSGATAEIRWWHSSDKTDSNGQGLIEAVKVRPRTRKKLG